MTKEKIQKELDKVKLNLLTNEGNLRWAEQEMEIRERTLEGMKMGDAPRHIIDAAQRDIDTLRPAFGTLRTEVDSLNHEKQLLEAQLEELEE